MVLGETVCIQTGGDSNLEVTLPLVPAQDLELLDLLGAGGFGSVHYGLYDGTYEIAIKRNHQRLGQEEQRYADSFLAEIRAATLHHENIVRVLGICSDHQLPNELPLIIMEYAGERNLQTVIEDPREVIDVQRRVRFATEITCALDFAHSHGILHLDVKPLNVIVSSDDHCKLGDFGCCQSRPERNADTPTKSLMTGTFAYKAPELLRGKVATDKSDVYSLAICLWQLFSRERPYGQEEHQVIVFSVVARNQRPDMPEEIPDAVDQTYCDLFQKAWDADPAQRPSAKDLHRSLKDLHRDPSG